jgi:hypothetical protein
MTLTVLLVAAGCSSESDNKTPKAAGVDPNARPVGRGAGGGGPVGKQGGAGGQSQAPIGKN